MNHLNGNATFASSGRVMSVVGVAGIEPATSCSQSKRAPAALHPDCGGGKGKAGVGGWSLGVAAALACAGCLRLRLCR